MTNITLQLQDSTKNLVKMKDTVPGQWYIIREYEHNHVLVGKIGLAYQYWDDKEKDYTKVVILMGEHAVGHEDLVFEEISEVTISVKV